MDYKQNRKNEDIHREIAAMIREEIKDPRVRDRFVSVVKTVLSGDGSVCKVYISAIDGIDAAKEAVKGLESASGLIRHEIGTRLRTKKTPELKFIADNSIEYSAKIIKELDDLKNGELTEKMENTNDTD
jgi:ribosome-binding factor A